MHSSKWLRNIDHEKNSKVTCCRYVDIISIQENCTIVCQLCLTYCHFFS